MLSCVVACYLPITPDFAVLQDLECCRKKREIGMYEDLDGIDIITNARHGWRKNAKDTSVVAVGERSHKILNCVHITTADDPVTQRHEKIGTEKIYRDLEAEQVTVHIHTHDRNLSINKMVKETVNTTNQNDIWHGIKSVKNAMSLISSGPRYKEGKTWSEELYGKPEPVATHFYWSIKKCNGDSSTLRSMLENCVEHYKGNHKQCHFASRCKKDPNYEPSKIVIQNPGAKKLLRNDIINSLIYKYPEDFKLGLDTY